MTPYDEARAAIARAEADGHAKEQQLAGLEIAYNEAIKQIAVLQSRVRELEAQLNG